MTKPDIVTSALTVQGNPVRRDIRKDSTLLIFKGKCSEMKGHVFDVRGALSIDASMSRYAS